MLQRVFLGHEVSDQLPPIPGLFHNNPSRLICYWKNALVGFYTITPDIFFKSIGYLFWDECGFSLSFTFRFANDELSILDVFRLEFENLTNSHSSTGHQFQHESVP